MSSIYISDNYVLSTNPAITCTLSYETKRENNNAYYRFKIAIQPNNAVFAYNLKLDITLNGKKILSGGTLKNTSPSRWTAPIVLYFPHKTGWYQVSDVGNAETLSCAVKFYSTQTAGTATSTGRVVHVPKAENSLENIKVKVDGTWKNVVNVFMKVNGTWKTAEKAYIKINGVWR